MELRKNEDGTQVFHVFFKASPDAWYYFGYEDNRFDDTVERSGIQ